MSLKAYGFCAIGLITQWAAVTTSVGAISVPVQSKPVRNPQH